MFVASSVEVGHVSIAFLNLYAFNLLIHIPTRRVPHHIYVRIYVKNNEKGNAVEIDCLILNILRTNWYNGASHNHVLIMTLVISYSNVSFFMW